jgi:hypothetical protein
MTRLWERAQGSWEITRSGITGCGTGLLECLWGKKGKWKALSERKLG